MNYSSVYNLNKRQFNSTMKREKITVTDYWDNTITYDVFFRRDKRSTSPQGKLRLYYLQSTPITIGTIFLLKGVPYLVTSQDGIESDVYYTSMAVKCDTSFKVYYNKKYIYIPCSVISDKYTLSHGSTISMTSGSVIVYTADNAYSKAIKIDSEYEKFGNCYKIGNTFYNNGLAYVYMEQTIKSNTDDGGTDNGETNNETTDETIYGEITATSDTIKVGGSYKTLTIKFYNENDEEVTDDYAASTFTWTCAVEDEDLTDTVTWLSTSTFNQMKIKFPSDRNYLGKVLTVKCVVDNITTTKDFELTA